MDLKKKIGGGRWLCPNILLTSKMLGGEVCQQIYGLEKCLGGVMPKYYRDLKQNVGGGGGVMPKYFTL